MSNKANMKIKHAESRRLETRIRFQGFTMPWEEKELNPFLKEYSERVQANTSLPVYSSTRAGLIPQKDYYNGRELVNDGEYGVVPDGFFVYRHMSDDGAFKFNINKTGERIAVSKEYPVFSTTVDLHPNFLLQKINEGEDFKRFALTQKKGGTRTRLYFSALCSWKTFLPTFDEQQKIADCLSSIDELISAEAKKLGTLQTHKKGLMQSLFPAEGETVPRLRFSEFRDAGEWDTVPMGGLLARNPEYGMNAPAVPYSKELPTYLRITDISDDGRFLSDSKVSVGVEATDDNYLEVGDIVLARTGASVGKSYRYRKEDGRLVFAGFLIRIRPEPTKVNSVFLANFLTTHRYWNWVAVISARSGQPGINGSEYSSLSVPVPSCERDNVGLPEQQKIADCLASLDDLITSQNQKLDALKSQKKGLMRRLFPSLDEGQG